MTHDDRATVRRRRNRARRRRRLITIGLTALAIGGASSAWALSRSSGPRYRLAAAERAAITQTVGADGTLSTPNVATESFAAGGTVDAVRVKTGQHVTAGQTLASIDQSSLTADVVSARNSLATARAALANDEAAQTSAVSEAAVIKPLGRSRGSTTIRLASTQTPTTSDGAVADAIAKIRAAQADVVAAQSTLDSATDSLTTACTTSGDVQTTEVLSADSTGTVQGSLSSSEPAVVTLADQDTTSQNPQVVATGGTFSFAGLTPSHSYKVVLVPVVSGATCANAINAVTTAKGSTGSTDTSSLYGALKELNTAVAALEKAKSVPPTSTPTSSAPSGPNPSGSGAPTGKPTARPTGKPSGNPTGRPSGRPTSAPTGHPTETAPTAVPSGVPSGSGVPGSTETPPISRSAAVPSTAAPSAPSSGETTPSGASGTTQTITAADIAADQKAIDAAQATLAAARYNVRLATLTAPISGRVASVDLAKGETVNAGSTTKTITIVGQHAMTVTTVIGIADIDLVKVGQNAKVLVDGRSNAVTAKVTRIGITNASSSSGSSATYSVTLTLNRRDAQLRDGMGASVTIYVAAARDVLTVPISALQTSGSRHSVVVYSHGTASIKQVTVGVEATDRVQITSGLARGEQVIIADLRAALPSSDSPNTSGGSLSSLTGGGGGPPGGGFPGGGFPGGALPGR